MFDDAINLLSRYSAKEVIPFLYTIEEIEKYLTWKRTDLSKAILLALNKTCYYRDEGNLVQFTDELIEIVTGFERGLTAFIKEVKSKKIQTSTLLQYYNLIVKSDEWYFEETQ